MDCLMDATIGTYRGAVMIRHLGAGVGRVLNVDSSTSGRWLEHLVCIVSRTFWMLLVPIHQFQCGLPY